MSLNQAESIQTLCEMFPACDVETVKLVLLECGSFDRAMERLLQGDRTTTWKTAKPKTAQPQDAAQQAYNQHFPPLSSVQHPQQTQNHSQNTAYYPQMQTNYQPQQQQMQYSTQQTQQQPQFNKNYVYTPPPQPQFSSNNAQTTLQLPSELSNIQTNSNLFGSKDFFILRTNSENEKYNHYNSPFSTMPMDLTTSEKMQINSDKYPTWNFSSDFAPMTMRLSKSVDALRQIDLK